MFRVLGRHEAGWLSGFGVIVDRNLHAPASVCAASAAQGMLKLPVQPKECVLPRIP